jgi:hypothetical protein
MVLLELLLSAACNAFEVWKAAMTHGNIIFESGSGSSDSSAELFRFNAYDDGDHVLCAISREAFQALSGTLHLDPASADVMFVSWENSVFDIARIKYATGELQDGCALVVRASDIAVRD